MGLKDKVRRLARVVEREMIAFELEDGTKASTTVPQRAGRDIAAGTLRAIERDLEKVLGEGWLR